MVKINKLLACSAIGSVLAIATAQGVEVERNTAQMQAMDKITGRVSVIEVPVNGEVAFGSFSIVVRNCKTTPPEETPENYAFVDVTDSSFGKSQFNIFKGWMMSSSPALNAIEHPIYDVWLLKCLDSQVDKSKLLSEEQLKDRDGLPKLADIKQDEASQDSKQLSDELESMIKKGNSPEVNLANEIKVDETVKPEEAVVETQTVETTVEAIAEDQPQESGPKSLINIADDNVAVAPVAIPAEVSTPDAPVDGTQPNIVPVNTEELSTTGSLRIEDATPIVMEPEVISVEQNVASPTTETVEPTTPTSEIPAVENNELIVPTAAPTPTDETFEEEDQFIDLSSEAGTTENLEAELSAEALKP